MIRTSDLDKSDTVTDVMIANFLNGAAWAIRSTYHMVLRTTPGKAIFGRDMFYDISYLADWTEIGKPFFETQSLGGKSLWCARSHTPPPPRANSRQRPWVRRSTPRYYCAPRCVLWRRPWALRRRPSRSTHAVQAHSWDDICGLERGKDAGVILLAVNPAVHSCGGSPTTRASSPASFARGIRCSARRGKRRVPRRAGPPSGARGWFVRSPIYTPFAVPARRGTRGRG